jgi:hypothetical protein
VRRQMAEVNMMYSEKTNGWSQYDVEWEDKWLKSIWCIVRRQMAEVNMKYSEKTHGWSQYDV